MNTSWYKGPRHAVIGVDNKGKTLARRGKNGGQVFEQRVVKILTPKAA